MKDCIFCRNTFGSPQCVGCKNYNEYEAMKYRTAKTDYTKFGRGGPLPIQSVLFNPPATIVFWNDGTKTVVKCENETFDPEKGLAMAIAKRALGNKGNYYNEFKKWIEVDTK